MEDQQNQNLPFSSENKIQSKIQSRNLTAWLAVAVLVILAVFYFAHNGIHPVVKSNQPIIRQGLSSGYVSTPVALGKYPKELPKDLILYPQVAPIRGEVTTPPGGATQVITAFVVADSPAIAFNKYVSYLEKNSWKKQAESQQASLYFTRYVKLKNTLDVTVSQAVKGTQVELDYVAGK